MSKPTVLAGTLALCGAAALVGLSATPAAAASRDLAYSCDWGVDDGDGGVEGSGDAASATWDSGIADDLVVATGTSVPLSPYTGTITLPTPFVDALRAQERPDLAGGGFHLVVVDESEQAFDLELLYGPTAVPAEGPMTLQVEGLDEVSVDTPEPGTYTLVTADFQLFVEEDENTGLACELTDEGDPTIDAFEAVGEAPTTTPPATTAPAVAPSPIRPALVQTDAAEGGSSGGHGLAWVGGALSLALAAGLRHVVRRAPRRH
ncbi:hypothetical protein [Phycicoccus sonneratiae]|uniref:LPXTG cell wall anchor domain-containing protein n=1 Tax=Phycicoccus sonneratiae TaxID=2807628 RepID=A0ABS2CJA6_9MICO|nr:hypothetical protein [Phycicoccus sonneraticus]MBM6399964.1 hypothetical protein [Phycicoccus sonneraticus]